MIQRGVEYQIGQRGHRHGARGERHYSLFRCKPCLNEYHVASGRAREVHAMAEDASSIVCVCLWVYVCMCVHECVLQTVRI